MASVTIDSENLNVELGIWDQIWAFHGSLRVPLEHVSAVHVADQNAWSRIWGKLVGTSVPGMKTAGTFFSKDGMIFCDYADGAACLEIDVVHEFYKKLIVQLDPGADPAATAARIAAALKP